MRSHLRRLIEKARQEAADQCNAAVSTLPDRLARDVIAMASAATAVHLASRAGLAAGAEWSGTGRLGSAEGGES